MKEGDFIKCRYCDWKTPRFRGKAHWWPRMQNHLDDNHENEAFEIQVSLDEMEDLLEGDE